jgi:site-specific DNA-methyltransferase (adenine-specific)
VGFVGQSWDTDVAFAPAFWEEVLRVLKPGGYLISMAATRNYDQMAHAVRLAGFDIRDMLLWLYGSGMPKSHPHEGGRGTGLKPAVEPSVLARKPLSEKTIAANIAKWGTGALFIDDSRAPGGRYPANVLSDGSEAAMEVLGDAWRYFYCAKASTEDRVEGTEALTPPEGAKRTNWHPTVKPTPVMEHYVGLITPPDGVVFDPFMGSGSTGKAAIRRGFRFLGCDSNAEYIPIAMARLQFEARRQAEKLRQNTLMDL